MIIRGTTPTMTFRLPVDAEMIEVGYIVVKQNEETIIEKPSSDCEWTGKTLSTKFTQEETLKLIAGTLAGIKVVVKTKGGERMENERPIFVGVVDTYKEGVI